MPDWFKDALGKGVCVPGGISKDAAGNFYVWFDSFHFLMLDVDHEILQSLRSIELEFGALGRADNI